MDVGTDPTRVLTTVGVTALCMCVRASFPHSTRIVGTEHAIVWYIERCKPSIATKLMHASTQMQTALGTLLSLAGASLYSTSIAVVVPHAVAISQGVAGLGRSKGPLRPASVRADMTA
jgi:hypothetical protein